MRDEVDPQFFCSNEDKAILYVIEKLLPRLITSFRTQGATKADVEDLFSSAYESVREYMCRVKCDTCRSVFFFKTKKNFCNKIPQIVWSWETVFKLFYERLKFLWLDELQQREKLKNYIDKSKKEEQTYSEPSVEIEYDKANVAFWECYEKRGNACKKILDDFFANEEYSNTERSINLGYGSVEAYNSAASLCRRQMKLCLEANPKWLKRFD